MVATHKRGVHKGQRITDADHLPKDYQEYASWSGPKFRSWAKMIGPNTHHAIDTLLSRVEYEVQAFRGCIGILNLAKKYSDSSLEEVCTDAVAHDRISYRYIKDSLVLAGEKIAKAPAAGNEVTVPKEDPERYVLKKREGSFSLENLRRNSR